jgi:hypothetical protein
MADGHGNIQTARAPTQIRSMTESSSVLQLSAQETRVANEGLLDAYWEVTHTLRRREKVLKVLVGVPAEKLTAMDAMYHAIDIVLA